MGTVQRGQNPARFRLKVRRSLTATEAVALAGDTEELAVPGASEGAGHQSVGKHAEINLRRKPRQGRCWPQQQFQREPGLQQGNLLDIQVKRGRWRGACVRKPE